MTQFALPLADDDTSRTQIRELLDETLFVEAGAGTGKTTALVDRYVALVLAGRRVDEIVAITFTEKAAAELKDRVRGELEKRLSEGGGDPALLTAALVSLDRAQISTIHAFALGALRSFAAEMGINPSFGVQDEVSAERRFEDKWRNQLEHMGQDPQARAAVNRVLELGMWTSDLEKLAHELWRNTALAEMLHASPLGAGAVPDLDVTALLQELLDLNLGRVIAGDDLLESIKGIVHSVQQLVAVPPAELDTHLATLVPSLKVSSYGKGANWGGVQVKDNARAVARQVCATLETALEARRSRALADLLPYLVGFVIEESRSRLRDGELTFDDLILQLRNVLRDNEDARRNLRRRYRTLLIDEFQDTDPLQTEIALAFARDPATGHLEPGRVFLVGDPKQSIYRFRRADMTVYSATRRVVEGAGGQLPQLATNRRSRQVILDFVNHIFESLIGHGDDPAVQAPYRPIVHHRDEALAGPGVARIGSLSTETARAVRTREAEQIAAYCRAAQEQGWQVAEREGTVRAAAYRDIAVLVPTRAILQPLERALGAAGIPYRVEGGSLVYATQDVRDIINCLTAVDDPTDDIAIVGALRSPAYACSDVELARFKLTGGTFNYLSPALNAGDRVSDALLDLRAFHETRHASTLAALVEGFVAEHRTVEAGLYDSANRNAFRRARFMVEQARIFESERPESLRAFIEWLERRAGDAILDHEGAGLDDDEDAVRVLTIHAAKGLEFPIVFVAGLGTPLNNQASVLGLDRTTGEIAVSIGAKSRNSVFTLGPVAAINAVESRHQVAERNRLLYVATTRARDHLIVSLHHAARSNNTDAGRLIEAGILDSAVSLDELEVREVPSLPFSGLTIGDYDGDEEHFDETRRQLVEGATRPLVTSATALGRMQAEDEEREREDETEPWARGRAGTHRGRAVHAALQVMPWDAADTTIDALARAQAVAEAIPEEAASVADLLRRALGMDAVARARNARRALREVPFAFTDEGVTLEGFIDVVLEHPDGTLEIVDWKTDSVAETAVPRRLEEYRKQAGLYVLGLERATGRSVERVTYVFITPGIEASPGDPRELADAALSEMRARMSVA